MLFKVRIHAYIAIYLKPSYFSDTLILAIFVGKDLAYFYFSNFTEL